MKLTKRRSSPGIIAIAALLSFAPSVRAHTVSEIIEKVRSALGIDAFEQQAKTVQLTGPLEFVGLKGTHTLTFDAAGRFRSTYDAALRLDTIFDGKTVRARDIGGEVIDQTLGDRTESLFDAWAATGLWFSKERCKGFALDQRAGDEKTVVLKMDLDDGRVWATVTIDRESWRPIRWVFGRPISKLTMEMKGDIQAGALHLPKKIIATNENGSVTIAEFTHAQIVSTPDWSADQGALTSPVDTAFDKAVAPRLEVKQAPSGHLLVHPLVDGKDIGWFIFDSGAGQNVLDKRTIRKLELKTFGSVPAVGAGGTSKASFCRPASIQIGPMTIRQPLATELDLAFLDPFMGVKVAGIIGFGTLARCVVEIDANDGVISVYDPKTYRLDGAEWTPLILYNQLPAVPGRFEDHEAVFRLDTGAVGPVTFHAPTVERLKLLDGRKTGLAVFGGVGGRKTSRSGKVKWLEFGGKRQKKLDAIFATEAVGAFADPYIDANIGGGIIGKCVMVLDYPRGRIAFKWKPEETRTAEATSEQADSQNPLSAKSTPSVRPVSGPSAHGTSMTMVNDSPVIELRVNGNGPYRFIFDTGAGVTVLTPELARELKLRATGKTQIGDPAAPHAVEVDTVAVEIDVCGEKFDDVPAVVWDNKSIFSALGDVSGIIGTAALIDRVVTLDFAEKQLRLSTEPLSESEGTVPCDNHHGIPQMELTIAGETIPVQLDTGKTRDLSVPAKLRHKLALKSPPVSAQGGTASGKFEMEVATLDGTVEFAGRKIVDPELEMTDRFSNAVMGTGILRRFVIDIDLAHERARFTPIKGWKPPDSDKRRYGFMMSVGDGPASVVGVVPGGIAERAGLKKGDRILKANGQDFESLDLGKRAAMVRASPLALTVGRDEKEIEIRLAFDEQDKPTKERPN